jgi:hypothetical protein
VLLFFLAALSLIQPAYASMIQRLDGRVVRADLQTHILLVQFEHPVSGENIQKEFEVTESTGFKRVKGLGKIRSGDLVTVDYREEGTKIIAIYIDVVPIDRQPVSPAEFANSLGKINSANRK